MVADSPEYATPAVPQETPDRTVERPVRRVRVVGPKAVYGVAAGQVGDLELTDDQYRSLVRSGHIEDAPETPVTNDNPPDDGSPAENTKDGD